MSGAAHVARGLALRHLTREPLRTLLTIFGIAVGIAVIVAVQLANRSAIGSFTGSIDAIAGRANFQIAADAGSLDESMLLDLRDLWSQGVRFAPVIDVESALASSGGLPIRVLGVDLMSDLHFRDYEWASIATRSGDETIENPEAPPIRELLTLFQADSAILPAGFAAEQGLSTGSSIRIAWRDRQSDLVVRGLLHPRGPATAFNGSLAILDIAAAQRALRMEGLITRIDLILPDPVPLEMERFIQSRLPEGARLERPSRRNERVNRMLRAFRVNLYALSAVALLVGTFLVYNTVLISILRRRREIGIFRTLGVSTPQIFFAFLAEGAVLGLIGSVMGVVLGRFLASAALALVGRTVDQLYVYTGASEVSMEWPLAAGAIGIGLIISLAAAFQPAWEASRVLPGSMIRPGIYQRLTPRQKLQLGAAAAAALAAAWIAARIPAADGLPVGGYTSVVLIVGGFSLLTPLVLAILSRLLGILFGPLFGIVGRLAAASIPASLRRTAIATAALAVSIAMMVSVAIMIGSFRRTVDIWVGQTVQSDLWVRPARGLSNADVTALRGSIAAELRAMPEIAAIDRYRGTEVVWRDSIIAMGSGDFDVAQERGALPMVVPESHRDAMKSAVEQRGVLISESLALKQGIDAGDSIQLPTPAGPRSFPVTGIYRDYSNDRGVVVMDRSLWMELFDDDTANTIAIFLHEGVDPERARQTIEARIGAKYSAFVSTNASIRAEVMRIFDQTFMITWALLAVALTVAVLGIVNTLTALLLERKQEIALLRILGMDRGEISLMVVLEAAVLGVVSLLLGVICGWILSWILIFVINRQSFGWTIELHPPSGALAFSLALTFLATLAAAAIPAQLARGVDMAKELKGE
ncbi:MAG TPA: FtsX-like permease family protein [Thermoanaerobaculia bacterium]|nr:FtsX-like permease family protein [Thermoanaerobaculia bacterium]